MKIASLRTERVMVPLDQPIKTAIHHIEGIGCVLVTLETSDGVQGEGYVFTMNGARLKTLQTLIEEFSEFVIGADPHFVEGIWDKIFHASNWFGQKGAPIIALSAIDTALWDIVGKAVGLPLHRVFGACRDRIPTYASGGLWLSQSAEDCAAEAARFVADGFKAVKLRVGSKTVAEDVHRARLVREAIGPDIALMADANQSLSVKHAIQLGRALEPFDLFWFEEPVPFHDLKAHREIRDAIPMRLATGETEYTRHGMRAIIEADAADVLMPDLQRIGGLTEFRRAGALAAAFDIPVSSHIFTEHSLSVAASLPNCISVEHMPWTAPILNEAMEMVDGDILIPERPGTGFTFNRAQVERLKF